MELLVLQYRMNRNTGVHARSVMDRRCDCLKRRALFEKRIAIYTGFKHLKLFQHMIETQGKSYQLSNGTHSHASKNAMNAMDLLWTPKPIMFPLLCNMSSLRALLLIEKFKTEYEWSMNKTTHSVEAAATDHRRAFADLNRPWYQWSTRCGERTLHSRATRRQPDLCRSGTKGANCAGLF